MANPIGGISGTQKAAQVQQTQAEALPQAPKQTAKPAEAPKDTVTISAAGKAASQAQHAQAKK